MFTLESTACSQLRCQPWLPQNLIIVWQLHCSYKQAWSFLWVPQLLSLSDHEVGWDLSSPLFHDLGFVLATAVVVIGHSILIAFSRHWWIWVCGTILHFEGPDLVFMPCRLVWFWRSYLKMASWSARICLSHRNSGLDQSLLWLESAITG